MKTIITPTLSLEHWLWTQIKNNCPREWLKNKLLTDDTSDNRVNFAHAWVSGVLTDNDWILRSYAVIGQDDCFNMNMAKYMQLHDRNTITLMYLFTVEKYRNKWYAKQLFENLCEYVYENYRTVDNIILSCSDKNKLLYQSWGGKLHHCVWINSFLRQEWIDADNYFSFSLR